jgi:hypothetical protein
MYISKKYLSYIQRKREENKNCKHEKIIEYRPKLYNFFIDTIYQCVLCNTNLISKPENSITTSILYCDVPYRRIKGQQ